jgi:hypothetical protein
MATHSSDIVSDTEPQELLIVDKYLQSARRINNLNSVGAAFEAIGSAYNPMLTQVARTRRAIFVEGEDLKLIDLFARQLNIHGLASNQEFSTIALGGFPTTERLKAICMGIREALGVECLFGGIFDSDYKSTDELALLRHGFESELNFVHIHAQKELENYLLVPPALDRAMQTTLADRVRREERASPTPNQQASFWILLQPPVNKTHSLITRQSGSNTLRDQG